MLILVNFQVMSLGGDESMHKTIHEFDIVFEGSFRANVEISLNLPEWIHIAPINQSIGLIKCLHKFTPFFACPFQAIQFHSKSYFEYRVQRASHQYILQKYKTQLTLTIYVYMSISLYTNVWVVIRSVRVSEGAGV